MNAKDIIYNYLEFFFTKDDLKSMLPIKDIPQEIFLETISSLNEPKPKTETFNYNIMHNKHFIVINDCLKEIEDISKKDSINFIEIKEEIKEKINKIEQLYKELIYYDEIYVYAHYVFNRIRRNEDVLKMMSGGGTITLEQFKELIRNYIKEL